MPCWLLPKNRPRMLESPWQSETSSLQEASGQLPSKKDPNEPEPESQPPDLFSSVETRAMLEEFRELVRAGILRVTPENEVLPVKPPSGGAEKPSAEAREEDVALLDKQLLEWMERRRQRKASEARRRGPAKPEETL